MVTKRDIAKNMFWAVSGKLVTLGGGLLVGIFVARYLGPEQFGLMNYVMSYVMLFQVLATLGLDNIEIREESKAPDDYNKLIGTAFVLRMILSLFTLLAVFMTTLLTESDIETIAFIMIFALSIVANTLTTVRNYFASIVQNKYVAKSEIARTFVGVVFKLFLLWVHASLVWFVIAMTLDFFLLAGGYLVLYKKEVGSPREWYFDKSTARHLVMEALPLLLTSTAVIIYQRIDQVMIGQMVDKEAVGYFSVAAKVVEVLIYLSTVAVQTVIPILVREREHSEVSYVEKAQLFMNVAVWSITLVSVFMSLLSYWIIILLFGDTYIPAVPILRILSFKAAALALSSAAGCLLIIERLQKWAICRDGFGCIVCVVLNYLLLPHYGAIASAVIAILSNLCAGYLVDAIIPPYRHFFVMQTKTLFLGWLDMVRVGRLYNDVFRAN